MREHEDDGITDFEGNLDEDEVYDPYKIDFYDGILPHKGPVKKKSKKKPKSKTVKSGGKDEGKKKKKKAKDDDL